VAALWVLKVYMCLCLCMYVLTITMIYDIRNGLDCHTTLTLLLRYPVLWACDDCTRKSRRVARARRRLSRAL